MRNAFGGSNMRASIIVDPDPVDPGDDDGDDGGGAGQPTGTWDPYAKTAQNYIASWGSHLYNAGHLVWKQNSGLPGRMRCKYIGSFCNATKVPASLADPLAMLNQDTQSRVRIGVYLFPGQKANRPTSENGNNDAVTLGDVADGDWDGTATTGLLGFANKLNLFTDDQLKRTIITTGHEVGGRYFRHGPSRNGDAATDVLLATNHIAAHKHFVDTVRTVLGVRKNFIAWDYNTWGTYLTYAQDAVEDHYPGDSYVDYITIDRYGSGGLPSEAASGTLMLTQSQTMYSWTDAFCAAHGNKPTGNMEFAPAKQGWGKTATGEQAPDKVDRQTVQLQWFTDLDTWARSHFVNNRWVGGLFFEKSIGEPGKSNPPIAADGDAYGTDEAKDMRVFYPREMWLGSTRFNNANDTAGSWRATIGTNSWSTNYPTLAQGIIPIIRAPIVYP